MRTLVALFGAPGAWLAQLLLSEPIAAYACYPFQSPASSPVWQELPAILAAISLSCLAAALLSGYVAWASWRQLTRKPNGEKPDLVKKHALSKLFLGTLGMMSSFVFIIAVIFNGCALLLVSPCSPWF